LPCHAEEKEEGQPSSSNAEDEAASSGSGSDVVKFIELFAGIGGFRVGLQQATPQDGKPFRCVYASEMDRFARLSYEANFGEAPAGGDITMEPASAVPVHHLLTAGFPCQPFSSVGKRKGLDDERGGLFRHIIRLAKHHRPRGLLLENVPGLLTIDGGATLATVVSELEQAGFSVQYKIVNSSLRVPQHRKRLYFVCLRRPAAGGAAALASAEIVQKKEKIPEDNAEEEHGTGPFAWPDIPDEKPRLQDALEEDVPASYTLSAHKWEKVQGQAYYQKHPEARVAKLNGIAQTLQSSYKRGYMLYSQFIPTREGEPPRFLTPRECCRLQVGI